MSLSSTRLSKTSSKISEDIIRKHQLKIQHDNQRSIILHYSPTHSKINPHLIHKTNISTNQNKTSDIKWYLRRNMESDKHPPQLSGIYPSRSIYLYFLPQPPPPPPFGPLHCNIIHPHSHPHLFPSPLFSTSLHPSIHPASQPPWILAHTPNIHQIKSSPSQTLEFCFSFPNHAVTNS